MDTNQLNRSGKRKKKNNLNNKQLRHDYSSITSLQTYNFVKQSKENYKNLNGVESLRKSTKIGRLFQNLYIRKIRISKAILLKFQSDLHIY